MKKALTTLSIVGVLTTTLLGDSIDYISEIESIKDKKISNETLNEVLSKVESSLVKSRNARTSSDILYSMKGKSFNFMGLVFDFTSIDEDKYLNGSNKVGAVMRCISLEKSFDVICMMPLDDKMYGYGLTKDGINFDMTTASAYTAEYLAKKLLSNPSILKVTEVFTSVPSSNTQSNSNELEQYKLNLNSCTENLESAKNSFNSCNQSLNTSEESLKECYFNLQNNSSDLEKTAIEKSELSEYKVQNLSRGWSLAGTSYDIENLTVFDSVDSVWSFKNNSWKTYKPSSIPTVPTSSESSFKIEAFDGFWIKK